MKRIFPLWSHWKKFTHTIGSIQGAIIFTLFYFLIIFPIGFIVKLISDPLQTKKNQHSFWSKKDTTNISSLDGLKKQY